MPLEVAFDVDRDAIWQALTREQRAAIRATLGAAALPPHAWLRIPSLRRVVAHQAALNRLRELEAGGMTRELATDIVAAELGLNPSTIASTIRRWALDAYGRSR